MVVENETKVKENVYIPYRFQSNNNNHSITTRKRTRKKCVSTRYTTQILCIAQHHQLTKIITQVFFVQLLLLFLLLMMMMLVDAVLLPSFSKAKELNRREKMEPFFSHYAHSAHSFAQLILLTNEMSRNVAIFVCVREKVCIATHTWKEPLFSPYF